MTKADTLRNLAEEVAQELEAASIGGAITLKEFEVVCGDRWLCWIPEDISAEKAYSKFTQALTNYRACGDPGGKDN